MLMINLVKETAILVVQVVGFIFPISIVIYAFQFPIWRENIDKAKDVVMEQQQRMSRKIICLFFVSTGTIFYAIGTIVTTSQITFNDCILWLWLISLIGLLMLTFYLLHSLFSEIGLIW
jgi:hypothetical protein